jgi:hypothetical protein
MLRVARIALCIAWATRVRGMRLVRAEAVVEARDAGDVCVDGGVCWSAAEEVGERGQDGEACLGGVAPGAAVDVAGRGLEGGRVGVLGEMVDGHYPVGGVGV